MLPIIFLFVSVFLKKDEKKLDLVSSLWATWLISHAGSTVNPIILFRLLQDYFYADLSEGSSSLIDSEEASLIVRAGLKVHHTSTCGNNTVTADRLINWKLCDRPLTKRYRAVVASQPDMMSYMLAERPIDSTAMIWLKTTRVRISSSGIMSLPSQSRSSSYLCPSQREVKYLISRLPVQPPVCFIYQLLSNMWDAVRLNTDRLPSVEEGSKPIKHRRDEEHRLVISPKPFVFRSQTWILKRRRVLKRSELSLHTFHIKTFLTSSVMDKQTTEDNAPPGSHAKVTKANTPITWLI